MRTQLNHVESAILTSTPVDQPSHRERIAIRPASARVGVAVLSVLAAVGLPRLFSDGPLSCPSRSFAGIACPCCGLTRSTLAVLDGELVNALTYNPVGPALVALTVIAAVRRRPTLVPPVRVLLVFVLVGTWNLTLNPTF